MVATTVGIISGNSLGISLTSQATLGGWGPVTGQAGQIGASGEQVFVNAATGNLVLSQQDGYLAAPGLDASLLRTYNSQGLFEDDNQDNWMMGYLKKNGSLTSSGTLGAAGSTVTRTGADGAQATYLWDGAALRYQSTAGAGAHDTMTYDANSKVFTWTDGDSGVREQYRKLGTSKYGLCAVNRTDPTRDEVRYWSDKLQNTSRAQALLEMLYTTVNYDSPDTKGRASASFFAQRVASWLAPLVGDANAAQAQADAVLASAQLRLGTGIASDGLHGTDTTISTSQQSSRRQLQVAQLFASITARTPGASQVLDWAARLEAGQSIAQVAQAMFDDASLSALNSPALYPVGQSASDFVRTFYRVALARASVPDDEVSYWAGRIGNVASNPASRGQALALLQEGVLGFVGNNAAGLAAQALFNLRSAATLAGEV